MARELLANEWHWSMRMVVPRRLVYKRPAPSDPAKTIFANEESAREFGEPKPYLRGEGQPGFPKP